MTSAGRPIGLAAWTPDAGAGSGTGAAGVTMWCRGSTVRSTGRTTVAGGVASDGVASDGVVNDGAVNDGAVNDGAGTGGVVNNGAGVDGVGPSRSSRCGELRRRSIDSDAGGGENACADGVGV